MPCSLVHMSRHWVQLTPSALPRSALPPSAGSRAVRHSPEPFSVDPEVVERGLRGHADTQNELAAALRNAGIEPRSCLPTEPPFDLAWQQNGTVFVAEVKSVNDGNEEGQLRLGLGQVLRYRQRLLALGHERVVAVPVPERQPRDTTWRELCHGLGVALLSRNELRQRAPALDVPLAPT
jgi:hypothetical protein